MMRNGGDIDGILQTIHDNLAYSSRVSLFNELHAWIGWVNHLVGAQSPLENIYAYAQRHLTAARNNQSDGQDFIHRLIALQEAGKINDLDLFNTIMANIAAGSDTTGLTLSAVIYHLARNPRCVQKLREEINTRLAQDQVSDPITFAEAQKMPYLQAIIKETLRVHPAVGMMLPRAVPPQGAEIEGYQFPGGVRTPYSFPH